LYADSRKWLANGWVDYLAPQLYWSIDAAEQSFPALLRWWSEQNAKNRNVYPGLDFTKASGRWKVEELINQIRLCRQQSGVGGHINWNMKTLMQNSSLNVALAKGVYQEPAIIPASAWLGGPKPSKPRLRMAPFTAATRVRDSRPHNPLHVRAIWDTKEETSVWLVQTRTGKEWKNEILPSSRNSKIWSDSQPEVISVTAIDRNGNLSPPSVLQRSP